MSNLSDLRGGGGVGPELREWYPVGHEIKEIDPLCLALEHFSVRGSQIARPALFEAPEGPLSQIRAPSRKSHIVLSSITRAQTFFTAVCLPHSMT